MPKYYYEIDQYGDIFEVRHSVSQDKFKNLDELWKFCEPIKNNKSDFSISRQETDLSYIEKLTESERAAIKVTRIIQPPNLHFKGGGWFSAQSRSFKYSGKNKKLYERLREERSKRKSKGLSVSDITKIAGIKSKSVSSVIDDNNWEKLSKEQKRIANEYGLRQSKDYLKN